MKRSTALLIAGFLASGAVAAPLSQTARADVGVPKVVVIVLENEQYSGIVGNGSAPYLNRLIGQGLVFSDYHAMVKGSTSNYRAMTAGVTTDRSPLRQNIFRAFDQAARNWTEFEESMTGDCGISDNQMVPGSQQTLYTNRHDPAYQYKGNESCATNDVPLTADAQLSTLPEFSMIVPNTCGDMHTYARNGACPSYFGPVVGGDLIEMGDTWLAHVVPLLLADPEATVIITFDEGTDATAQHIFTVEVGAGVNPGTGDAGPYDHFGLLAGLYAFFGLGAAPNGAATATPLPIAPERNPRLSVDVEGTGDVTSDPPAIDCGAGPSGTCSAEFAPATPVSLTATPPDGSVFDGWAGDCSGTDPLCVVSMDAARHVTATFGPLFTLSIDPPINGSVTSDVGGIDCPDACAQDLAADTAVTLRAQASPGFTFAAWGGDCDGVLTPTCTLTMDAAKTASVTFGPAPVVQTLDDDDPAVAFGGWQGVVDPGANGGGYHVSGVVNDKATWTTTKVTSVSWIAHIGPDGGKANVVIDGKSYGNVDLYSPAPGTLSKVYAGLRAKVHSVIVKVIGGADPASTGTNVSVDAFKAGATTVSDADPHITYDTWVGATSAHALGGRYRSSSSAASAPVTVTFSGTSIDWITVQGPAFGKAAVSIDGVSMGVVDLYAAVQAWQSAVTFGGMPSGPHRLVIQVLGQKNAASHATKVAVDGFMVQG